MTDPAYTPGTDAYYIRLEREAAKRAGDDLIDEMLRALKIARTWSDKDWVGYEHVERAIARAEARP